MPYQAQDEDDEEGNEDPGAYQYYESPYSPGAGPDPYKADTWQYTVADIPVVGGLSGAAGAVQRSQDEIEAARNRSYWSDLQQHAPSVDQITPDTYLEAAGDEYGNLLGGQSELGRSSNLLDILGGKNRWLNQLQAIIDSGGYTEADRSARALGAMERGQQMRGATEAALQQLQARGMTGGGMELGSRLQAAQGQSMGQAMGDAAQQQAAQARLMTALQQEQARRQALDSWNQQGLDWRRGRETRNTAWQNRGGESRANAYQQTYGNRERAAAGATGQYSTDVGARQNARDRQQQQDSSLLGAIGEILDF